MGQYTSSHPSSEGCRVTLDTLKDQLYSLNMRWRLSLQTNDEVLRQTLEQQISETQRQIDHMSAGR
jgi:hypothetical protein